MLVSPEEVRATLTALLPPHLRDAPTVPDYSRRFGVVGISIRKALRAGIDRRHLDRWVRRASAIAPEPPPVPASKAGLVLTADELAGASLAVLAQRHGVGIAVIRGLRRQAGIQTTRGRKSIPGYEISTRAPPLHPRPVVDPAKRERLRAARELRLTEARTRHVELTAALAALEGVVGDLAPEAAQVAESEAADLRARIGRQERKIGKLGRKRRS